MFYFSQINYFAIFGVAILHMIIGMLWYSPALFGRAWAGFMGFDLTDKAAWKEKQAAAKPAYILSFIGALITALALKLIFQATLISHIGPALLVGILLWLGFTGPMMLNTTLFSEKPVKLWMIDSFYYLVSIILMSMILIVWA